VSLFLEPDIVLSADSAAVDVMVFSGVNRGLIIIIILFVHKKTIS